MSDYVYVNGEIYECVEVSNDELTHAFGANFKRKGAKWIAKIPMGNGKFRYIYDPRELAAYKKMKSAVKTADKKVAREAIRGAINYKVAKTKVKKRLMKAARPVDKKIASKMTAKQKVKVLNTQRKIQTAKMKGTAKALKGAVNIQSKVHNGKKKLKNYFKKKRK